MTRRRSLTAAALLGFVACSATQARVETVGVEPATATAANPNPMDSISRLPGYRPALDTTHYLDPTRIERLARATSGAWNAYLEHSRRQMATDSAAMAAELASVGRTEMVRAPYARGFEIESWMTPAWFAGDSARRMAEIILSFQAPNGGWSKHVDFTKHERQPGESFFGESTRWQWISTIDNGSTTSEMRFLAMANAARPDARYRGAFVRGVRYLLDAQMPTGCWPQVWPLEGSYHDAITYNDDALVNAAMLLREVMQGAYPFVSVDDRLRAAAAIPGAVDCMVKTQVVVNGVPTIWGQQHDPLTFAPVSARSYELVSLASRESAGVVAFLMSLPDPDERVVRAVHHAVDWFRANALTGLAYTPYQRRDSAGAPPVWARMSEIGSNRPVFSNRDGIRLYDYEKLTDRRTGYQWYSYEPAGVLRRYDAWAAAHPRSTAAAGR